MTKTPRNNPFILTLRVENGEPVVIDEGHFESRGENALTIIRSIIKLAPEKLEGRSCYINFYDMPPPIPEDGEYDFDFCSTRWQHAPPEFLPFPCCNSPAWPEVGIPDGPGLIDDLLASRSEPKDHRLFWIGANTHPSRVILETLAKRHPKWIDAELMSWDRSGTDTQLASKTRYVSMWDHRHYKYLVDCPGTGYSARLRWLLATGRPVFIVDRPAIEHWHARMIPWVHYVPVRLDLSDLMYNLKRLEADPQLYEMISENAREFVRLNLTRGREAADIAARIPENEDFPNDA